MKRGDRRTFAAFAKAHRLGFADRRLCRRLAALYGLSGNGPETSPAMLFFRPSFWDIFIGDARQGAHRRVRAEDIERLKARIF